MPMPSLVLGTAGHIDHGKSSLIKALTGTDPDRLAEEKERGITIELGFARLELPSGRAMGVVDVPGHEKFVRQMVAGATGIDVVLLVVAADDGVMPQTREHLAIIDLLGIERGVVALTKADLVDADWLELVRDDVAALLAAPRIEGAPIVPVSTQDAARASPSCCAALDEVAEDTRSRQAEPADAAAGRPRLHDRGRGHGRHRHDVVGLGGQRRPGRALPDAASTAASAACRSTASRSSARMRVSASPSTSPASRRTRSRRGDIVAAPGTLTVTDRFDARFTYLGIPGDDRPFETGARVHVHHGTREVLGRVLLMDAEQLAPGERGSRAGPARGAARAALRRPLHRPQLLAGLHDRRRRRARRAAAAPHDAQAARARAARCAARPRSVVGQHWAARGARPADDERRRSPRRSACRARRSPTSSTGPSSSGSRSAARRTS